ncbi:NTF2 fold immunity protein [Pseudomonas alkylphenolica]|uniref:NTF2 fold immunity protein n=1 Tax=Pseudomonas alkylphenolica TaxID=237609 RepID=UPI003399451A
MNDELTMYLAERVRCFAQRWNKIEQDIRDASQREEALLREQYSGDEYHFVSRTDWFEKMAIQITPLFDAFCTDKQRVYGGKSPKSFGFPAKFNGIESPAELRVELKTKTRAEVYVKTSTSFEDEYLFVVLKKAGEWKIDGYKNRRYGDEKWAAKIL